jgi:hypothetical protein
MISVPFLVQYRTAEPTYNNADATCDDAVADDIGYSIFSHISPPQ